MLKFFFTIFFCAVILGQSACNNDEPIENSSDAQPASTKTQIQKNPPKPELNRWDVADRETIRLQPSVFSQLPENIVMELQSRQCTIPQIYDDPKPHNVISGEFKRRGQTDWAILCSKDRISSILMFWNGSVENPSVLFPLPNKGALQGIGNGRIGYSRYISVVGKRLLKNIIALMVVINPHQLIMRE